jgi:hypothetical protein
VLEKQDWRFVRLKTGSVDGPTAVVDLKKQINLHKWKHITVDYMGESRK